MENFCPARVPDKTCRIEPRKNFCGSSGLFSFYARSYSCCYPTQRRRQAVNPSRGAACPCIFRAPSKPGRRNKQRENSKAQSSQKKVAASWMKRAPGTFYVHAASPASGVTGQAARSCRLPPLFPYNLRDIPAGAAVSPFRNSCPCQAARSFFAIPRRPECN
jgi:hypothetical protein